MHDTPGDPASIAVVVDVAPKGPHAKALVNQWLIAREMRERLQKAPQTEGFDLKGAEFEALSSPDVALGSSRRLREGIEARLRRRSQQEAGHRFAIDDV